jgi:hypothetical protein
MTSFTSPDFSRFTMIQDMVWVNFLVSDSKSHYIFETKSQENGPKETYLLSLYVVNKNMHDEFNQCFEETRFGGLPMLPKSRRLKPMNLAVF